MNILKTIDCDYIYPEFAASFMIADNNEVAFIENNTFHAVPALLKSLQDSHLKLEQVKYIIITHVHLDHAGGTSTLLKHCPKAIVLAHPRAARHLIDPSKLIAGASQVYGEEKFKKLYGNIEPIASDHVQAMDNSTQVSLGGRKLHFIHTRGHANHHFCVFDESLNSIFTGDSFGVCYPRLQKRGRFIIPSTSPTDFDAPEAIKSLDIILNTGAKTALLTHYGEVNGLKECRNQLKEHIEFSQSLMLRAREQKDTFEELTKFCEKELRDYLKNYSEKKQHNFSKEDWQLLELDIKINAQGLAFAALKK